MPIHGCYGCYGWAPHWYCASRRRVAPGRASACWLLILLVLISKHLYSRCLHLFYPLSRQNGRDIVPLSMGLCSVHVAPLATFPQTAFRFQITKCRPLLLASKELFV
jgi:hypothetical protein